MTSWRPQTPPITVVPVPGEVKAFADSRNMNVVQINAQRMFGPSRIYDPNWNPPDGSEIFVGRIPRTLHEPQLVPFFEQVGPIFQLRLMMDFSGTNRGYGFVQYFNPDQAKKAVILLNEAQILPGRRIVAMKSVDNRRLILGGVPTYKSKAEIYSELKAFSDGLVRIWKRWLDPPKYYKGAVIVYYKNHRSAAVARSKMLSSRFTLWGYKITVDWAEPEDGPPHFMSFETQTLRLRNLSRSTTNDTILDLFNRQSFNGVKTLQRFGNMALISFYSRRHADVARAALNHSMLEGKEIEVDWADPEKSKPVQGQKKKRRGKSKKKRGQNDQASTSTTSSLENRNQYYFQRGYVPHHGFNQDNSLLYNLPSHLAPCTDPDCILSLENPQLEVAYPPEISWDMQSQQSDGSQPSQPDLSLCMNSCCTNSSDEQLPHVFYESDSSSEYSSVSVPTSGYMPSLFGGCNCTACWIYNQQRSGPKYSFYY